MEGEHHIEHTHTTDKKQQTSQQTHWQSKFNKNKIKMHLHNRGTPWLHLNVRKYLAAQGQRSKGPKRRCRKKGMKITGHDGHLEEALTTTRSGESPVARPELCSSPIGSEVIRGEREVC